MKMTFNQFDQVEVHVKGFLWETCLSMASQAAKGSAETDDSTLYQTPTTTMTT